MRLPFSKAHRPPFGALAAARALFVGAGPLARFRGPAAVVRADGAVVVANGAAWDHAALLGLAEAAPLRPEIAAAIADQKPASVTLLGEGATLTIEVLPLGDGMGLLLGRDGGVAGALNEALADSRARYKSLVELSSAFAWETGADGSFVFVSPKGALGWTADELVGREARAFMPVAPDRSPFAAREPVDGAIVWWRKKDGGEACLSVAAMPIERDGRWRGARGVCQDVTGERVHEHALARARHREDFLAHLVRLMRDAADAETMLASACETIARELGAHACRIDRVEADGGAVALASFGATSDEAAQTMMVLRAARAGGGFAAMESHTGRRLARPTQYRHAVNGVVFVERAPDGPPWSEEERALLAGIADQLGIALAQAAAQEALARASRTDPLTGLLNRRAFEDEMAARLKRPANAAAPGALLAVDLDNFKTVNDAHGHERGDDALKAVAALLTERTRPGDLVARLGGDEFAIWLERIDAAAAAVRADELVACAAGLGRLSGSSDRPLGFSVGVALRAAEADLASLMVRADAAMYAVKRRGKGGFEIEGTKVPLAPFRRRRAAGA